MPRVRFDHLPRPVGPLLVTADGSWRLSATAAGRPDGLWTRAGAPFRAVRTQLAEYFAGPHDRRAARDLLLGTRLQRRHQGRADA